MSFLSTVAQQLITTFGTDLSKVTVVFPNKRASLFLNEHLTTLGVKPKDNPTYTTISDLFLSLSDQELADPIKLICDLHKSFVHCTGMEETLDHFYGWGEILLADFDDVDKHLAPADKVFANLRDIHEFDDASYLTQQQRDIIRKFFSNFKEDHNSELKQRFLSLWSHLYDIYLDFNARLAAQNLAYEGSLYRQVIEKSMKGNEVEDCVFVGFNLLHPVEQALIDLLGEKATVIQDTDEETPKAITFISAPTNNIQARYIPTWLKENGRIAAGSKTAIVLADESLLQTVVHCLPPDLTKVNITTGYPLSQTAAAQGDCPKSPLELEAQYRLQLILDRLQALIDSGDLQVSDTTLHQLLTQIIASTSIPFHGEPIEGIQIMGVLETRNLDFDHVLLLSCNEGNLPKGVNDTSFIPYSIRKAYNLTTIDHKVAIYHNYFHRLLQRASDVTILYNNATNDGKTGEMSQFMLQMMVEGRYPITFKTLQAGQQPILHRPQPVTKTPEVIEALYQRFSEKELSPSALSLYLRCPLQFFYRYAAQLEEYEDEDDRIDNRLFGNIFHKAAHLLYTGLGGEGLSPVMQAVDQAIKLELFHIEDPMAKMPLLNGLQLISREVIIRYLHQLLEVDRRLAPFTILALEHPIYIGTSQRVFEPERGQDLPLRKHSARGCNPSQDVFERKALTSVRIGGVVDRIDLMTLPDGSERIRVVDYKTGNTRLKPLPDVAAIFDPANIKYHSDYYLQSILYSCILERSCSSTVEEPDKTMPPVSPCLLFIQHAGVEDYDPTLILAKTPITDVREIKDEFMEHLNNLITEIFDPAMPFTPTEEGTRCKSCPFSSLCGI
ncbi:MAG: PD-(D/E)XK nuclease family protein [Prevotella sp.]|nr:PD-(D/E)XK nuclease family protein [Prevotella sp.]